MAHITADRVRQLSTSTGTGPITVSTTITGFRAFSSVLSVGDTFWYTIAHTSLSEWEVGLGTYSAANTITRTTVLSSSTGSAVLFSAGDKDVFITAAAGKFLQADAAGSYGNFTAGTITAALTGNASGSAATFTSTTQNSQFNSIGVGVAASTQAGQINATALVASSYVTGYGGVGQLQAVSGATSSWYNAFLRNDGANVYLLSSAVQTTQANATNATWNAYRPFSWALTTGVVSIDDTGLGAYFGGTVSPKTTNTQTLGSSGAVWSNVYATTFTGALTGNATGFTSTTQNSQFNSIGVGVAASSTAGQINATGIIQTNKGIKFSDTVEPTYKINLDTGADLLGTWRKIVTVSLAAATQYSTQGFRIRLTDPAANHATQGSVDSISEHVYYVACVRTESTTIDTPDLCVVRGPSNHIQAVKLSTGNYEIQVQPLTLYREYIIEIDTYASNAASLHTITFSNGSVAGSTGIATYSASVGTGSLWVQKLKSVNGISLSEPGSTGDRLLLSTSTSGAIINQNHASSIYLQSQGTNRLVITSAGEVGIGTAATTAQSLGIGKTITGGSTAIGVMNNGAIQADVTGAAWMFRSSPSTVASAFTLPTLAHFSVVPGTLGASSIVTNEYGSLLQSTMVSATNTYGVSSNIVAQVAGGTAAATATSISQTTTTVTVTATAHGFVTGQYVTVAATANATSLVSGAWVTILTVGTTDFTLIGAASNTVGVSFTATGVGTGTGAVTLNAQGSGKSITVVDANTFTYTTTSATYTAITLLTGTITPATRWNIYAGGTAPNYFAGAIGIGSTAITNVNLRLGKTMTGSTTSYGIYNAGQVQSDVTAAGVYNQTVPSTVGAVTNIYYNLSSQGTFGGAVTNQYGFNSGASLIGATNNYAFIAENTAGVTAGKVAYGFFSNINIATGGGTTYNFYANGTAPNYFAGNVGIGTATPGAKLEVVGSQANFRVFSTDAAPFYIPIIKSRGVAGTQITVNNNDNIGSLQFYGYNGTSEQPAASITGSVDGVPSATSMPGRIVFNTTPAGTNVPAERMRIDNAGNVTPGVTNTQTLGTVGDVWSAVHANTVAAPFFESTQTISTSYTITTGSNAMTPGPITIAAGITVTVPSGSVWTIV